MKPARGPILWWLRMSRYKAITLPPLGIYALPEHLDNERLQRHEQEHWRQYKEMGVVKFYVMYLYYWVRFGYSLNHPMEKEAHDAENRTDAGPQVRQKNSS